MRDDEYRDALSRLYEAEGPKILGALRNLLRDDEDARDTLQDAFLQAWRDRERFDRSRGSAAQFVVMIARSRGIDLVRRRRSEPLDPILLAAHDDGADSRLERPRLERAFRELDDHQRKIIRLAYVEGMTQCEIARELRMPLGTVKCRMRTATMRMRNQLAET